MRTLELPGRWDDTRVVEQVLAWRARPGLVWLDGDGSRAGRWSWIACEPDEVVELHAGEPPLDVWRRFEGTPDDRGPAVPRWIGWIAYDALWDHALDGHRARRPSHARAGTTLHFARHAWVLGIDHGTGRAYVFADDDAALARWRALDDATRAEFTSPGGPADPTSTSATPDSITSETSSGAPTQNRTDDTGGSAEVSAAVTELTVTDAEDHERAIEAARAAIARGELYQVNLARRWEAHFEGDPLALALAMRRASPVPLGLFARTTDGALIGRSMERFLHWDRDVLETCPIKGTLARRRDRIGNDSHRHESAADVDTPRAPLAHGEARSTNGLHVVSGISSIDIDNPRAPLAHGEAGSTNGLHGDSGSDIDTHEASMLRGDPKEHAEHAMIVDLLRNDLARVARPGTVEVVDPLRVEPYAKLHHLVTTVRARTRPEVGLREVLAATFPPGSVTGAPKVAAVELIDALEPFDRGAYCGAYGYVTRAGHLSLAVAIRTAIVEGDRVRYFAGGGIVWPSEPAREVAETNLKARVFLDAIATLGAKDG